MPDRKVRCGALSPSAAASRLPGGCARGRAWSNAGAHELCKRSWHAVYGSCAACKQTCGEAVPPYAGLFDCKPLPLLWAKFPENYNEHNTVMLDDLARNYVFNKQNGLVIRPYRRAALHALQHCL